MVVFVSGVAEVIGMLAEVVTNTREIVEAVDDGRKFLASRHPEAQEDFAELLGQMEHTIGSLAGVTKVI